MKLNRLLTPIGTSDAVPLEFSIKWVPKPFENGEPSKEFEGINDSSIDSKLELSVGILSLLITPIAYVFPVSPITTKELSSP